MVYAVAKGIKPGIYDTWFECLENTNGFKGAVFKKFKTIEEAQKFINEANELNNYDDIDYFVYTDGSCINNGKENAVAGYGIFFGDDDPRNVSKRVKGKQSNNSAELTAIIKTYKIIKDDIKKGKKIGIITDSFYAIRCIKSYGRKQENNEWKDDIPNKELVKKIYTKYKNKDNVRFIHINSHTGNNDIHSINNDKVDLLAKQALDL